MKRVATRNLNALCGLWRLLSVALCLALPRLGHAQDACGSVSLLAGQIRTGKPLTADWLTTDSGKRCLADIHAAVERNRLVRAITVAFRAPDSERTDGKGLAAAKSVADALVAAGLPRGRVFAIAARSVPGEASGIALRYTERAPDHVVARIANLAGTVRVGSDDASLRAAEPAMPLLADDVVETREDGQALLQLKDGSGIRVLRSSRIKLTKMLFADAGSTGVGDRTVRIDVLRGQIEADVRKAGSGSSFEASTRVAVASVRGTILRFGSDSAGASLLETIEGRVLLGSALDPSAPLVEVRQGQGARVSSEGKVEPPLPLPGTPTVLAPLRGSLPATRQLQFSAVPGASHYRIELGRDADFLLDAIEESSESTTPVLRAALTSGKWFWRVTARNPAGFAGAPSKVFSFDVTP